MTKGAEQKHSWYVAKAPTMMLSVDIPMMNFPERMHPHLKDLVKLLLEKEIYGPIIELSRLLAMAKNGSWNRLSDEEQEILIEGYSQIFHPKGLGDSEIGYEDSYQACNEIVYQANRSRGI